MSLVQELKTNIELRFGEGQVFTVLEFPQFDREYHRRKVRSTLAMLCGKYDYLKVIGKVSTGIKGVPPTNRYIIKSKISTMYAEEAPAGTETIWHTKPPVNQCKDGEVYRVKMWDNVESHRVWKNATWWTHDGRSLSCSFIKEWRGVTR